MMCHLCLSIHCCVQHENRLQPEVSADMDTINDNLRLKILAIAVRSCHGIKIGPRPTSDRTRLISL